MRLRCSGFSLLEVILALAILTGAIAVLGEAARLSLRNAQTARELTRAQLLCESRMAEITAGLEPLETSAGDGAESANTEADAAGDQSGWLYSIDVQPIDQEGLVAVRVTVTRDGPPEQRPVEFSLVRWMLDPSAGTLATPSGSEPGSKQ